ncbi:DUF2502 domain-containing protein [Pectobacteriaceae bacterium CE70]|uniref:DUF2502 domain-containing protein n=1 Tax=Serratia sp. (strain ATCC 39006) TaxID=104623 RepID=A0A2I5TH73_SERS3|nr:DUF2502 domain-containing protein [Serratia sp. ATCC 39006]WJV61819.1 DUF2502 domain-containing protein [Pectobacteriaceae bacterium C52]WJV66088.1 DUF2502 domain-containing protein [Pectobacteriaceae bacterium CE70]WJY10102.1 DUF2502 domain-containing protein [Pectobacteriaceae bacterium C80]AUG99607.1 DUF2502 domain-containing protein [Serratia sp. ATCC 39006]AUH03925.1 DUF2502 domain-containing protein [Serratia sp. ATCC 39006]
MIKPLLFGVMMTGMLSFAVPTVQADSLSIALPGVYFHIGDRDQRGYYWDGNRWCAPHEWRREHRYHRPRPVYYYEAPPPRYYEAPPPRVVVVQPPRPVFIAPPPEPGWGHHYRGDPRW